MRKRNVVKYGEFINEEFFKRLFNKGKKQTQESKNRVKDCVS